MIERLCQSCGVHLDDKNRGTNANGSLSDEYCFHCLQKGYFTADLTREEMADFCAQFVDAYNQKADKLFSRDTFKYVLDSVLSTLKRWTLPADQLPPIASVPIEQRIIDEVNSLGLPDCPPIPHLKVMQGSLINFKYDVSGNQVQALDDNASYLCAQVEKTDGSERRYGIACNEHYIVVNECSSTVKDTKLVMIKRLR